MITRRLQFSQKLNKILKTQQADEDDKVRRQVLFSNIDLPVVREHLTGLVLTKYLVTQLMAEHGKKPN